MRKRTQARESALTILYQAEMIRQPAKPLAEEFWAEKEHKDPEVQKQIIANTHHGKQAKSKPTTLYGALSGQSEQTQPETCLMCQK